MANRPFQVAVSSVGFGMNSDKDLKFKSLADRELACDPEVQVVVDKTKSRQCLLDRAVLSHVTAMQQKLTILLAGASFLVHSDVSDEATMWVRKTYDSKDKQSF